MQTHYTERTATIFGEYSKYKTLRTIFDSGAHEWTETTMNQKLEALKKLLAIDPSLEMWLDEYSDFYSTELDKPYVVDEIPNTLKKLIKNTTDLDLLQVLEKEYERLR